MTWEVIHGDCLDVLRTMDAGSVDSIVCDPPYGLSFMGKKWDYDVPSVDVWAECLRVLKPGGHLLSFAGTRTQHRMAVRIEDAGFEIRDCIMYVFGSGFPKSKNIGCRCRGGAVHYTHETTSQDMPDMRGQLDARKPLPGGEEQDVLAAMQGSALVQDEARERRPVAQVGVDDDRLPGVRGAVHAAKCVAAQGEDARVLEQMQRETPVGSAREKQVRPDRDEVPRYGATRRAQPSVEGRRDVLAQAGQLQAGEVCAVPGAVHRNGEEGRLRDGAPPHHGDDHGAPPHARGSGASYQPRPARQQAGEPGAVPRQQGAQEGGVGTCEACGGIIGYEGYGTALKPAYEPVWLARKPLIGTVAENVTQYGTGALNIDGCRVEIGDGPKGTWGAKQASGSMFIANTGTPTVEHSLGRWPANLIHDGSEEVLAGFPATGASKAGGVSSRGNESTWSPSKGMNTPGRSVPRAGHDDNGGSAARFFYCAKADKADRDDGMHGAARRNHHPTVKPTDLMRYLCRLITPPGGIVLDPFTGSGSTGRGAVIEGFSFIGIEREADYCEIARKRIAAAAAQGNLFHEVVG